MDIYGQRPSAETISCYNKNAILHCRNRTHVSSRAPLEVAIFCLTCLEIPRGLSSFQTR